MENLTNLFKIMELTRSQPQYGYVTAGIQQDELSNLAEHHYLVTFMAWQLARQLMLKERTIDVLKVVEFSLVHDTGEIFGGDISSYYRKANPKALEHAKAFEEENQKFIAKFFGADKDYYKKLGHDILDFKSDEALIAKIADYMEIIHYKKYVGVFSKKLDIDFMMPKFKSFISKMKDPVAKRELGKFINIWAKDILKKEVSEILLENSVN